MQARCKGKAISVEPVPGFPVKRLTEVGQALLLQRKAPPPAGSAADGAAAGASSNGASSNGAGSADASAEEAQQVSNSQMLSCTRSRRCPIAALVAPPPTEHPRPTPNKSSILQVERRLELLLEARKHCAEYLAGPGEGEARSRDVLYLDLALASEVRNTLEGRMQALAACAACLQGADGAPFSESAALRRALGRDPLRQSHHAARLRAAPRAGARASCRACTRALHRVYSVQTIHAPRLRRRARPRCGAPPRCVPRARLRELLLAARRQ